MASRPKLTEHLVNAWCVLTWLALLAAVIYTLARGSSFTSLSLVISFGMFIVFSILAVHTTIRLFACLSLITLVVPFYLFEVYLWLTTAPTVSPSKAEYVAELRKHGLAAYPVLFPSGFAQLWQKTRAKAQSPIVIGGREILPLAGIPDVLTVYCPRPDTGWLTYRSDGLGFRNPPLVERSAAPEFALLGDSFAQGHCVPDSFTYAHQLSEMGLTLSYGMNATSALAQLAIFREYVKWIRPHHIIWFFFEGNDPREFLRERTWPVLRAYFQRGHLQHLVGLRDPIALAMRRFVDQRLEGIEVATAGHDFRRFAQNRSILDEMIDLLLLRRAKTALRKTFESTEPTTEMAETAWHELADIWREVIETQRAQGGQTTFVYLPARDRFLAKNPGPFQALESKVRALWFDLGAGQVSLTKLLEGAGNPLAYYQPDRLHFNEEGYRLTAKAIIEHLRRSSDG
jgi:hypothetical protein